MDSATSTDKITEWLNQQVDAAFRPLLEKIAQDRTPVQWEKGDFARTLRLRFEAGEVTYTITLDANSDPVAGQILFRTPEAEHHKSFVPALPGDSPAPGVMTGADLVNDLIDQYGQWCKRQATSHSQP